MGIDEVSHELGKLTAAVDNVHESLTEFKLEERARHDRIDTSLKGLIAERNERKGMLVQAKKQAKIWGAGFGAIVAVAIAFIKTLITGG